MNTTDLKIERVENPTREYFEKHIYTARKPVIITGVSNKWKAYSSWTVDYLNNAVGNTKITIYLSKIPVFIGGRDDGCVETKHMKVHEYLELLGQNNESNDTYYSCPKISMPQILPELMQDIELPSYCQNRLIDDAHRINFWMSASRSVSALHYDRHDNLFTQIRGRKRFVLLDPEQTSFLYPFPATSPKVPHVSQIINVDQPDLKQFPKFQKAKFYDVLLEEGEMLFLPVFWWHQVFAIRDDIKLPTISVNFWFKAPLMEWFTTKPGRRHAVQIPDILSHQSFKLHRKLTRKIKTKLKLKNTK